MILKIEFDLINKIFMAIKFSINDTIYRIERLAMIGIDDALMPWMRIIFQKKQSTD